MRRSILASCLVGVAAVWADVCVINQVTPGSGNDIAIDDWKAFNGAKVKLTLFKQDGIAVLVPTGWSTVTGDFQVDETSGEITIIGPAGGTCLAIDEISSYGCNVTIPPFDTTNYYHKGSAVNYFSAAVQRANGVVQVGEYYFDSAAAPIHLHPSAAGNKTPAENWFVASTGAAASLTAEPTTDNKNPDYVAVASGNLIGADDATALRDQYGDLSTMVGPKVWVVQAVGGASDAPAFTVTENLPYGKANVLDMGSAGVVGAQDATADAVVMSTMELGSETNPVVVPAPAPATTAQPPTGTTGITTTKGTATATTKGTTTTTTTTTTIDSWGSKVTLSIGAVVVMGLLNFLI